MTYDIDLAGYESWGGFAATENSTVTLDMFPFARIIAVEWIDLDFTSEGESWRSEFTLSLNDSVNAGAAGTFWDFSPVSNDVAGQSPGNYFGSGSFTDPSPRFNSGPFSLLADGQMVIYVYDSFDDGGTGVRDAVINSGILRITAVPEPSSAVALLSVVAIGGAFTTFKRRRRIG